MSIVKDGFLFIFVQNLTVGLNLLTRREYTNCEPQGLIDGPRYRR